MLIIVINHKSELNHSAAYSSVTAISREHSMKMNNPIQFPFSYSSTCNYITLPFTWLVSPDNNNRYFTELAQSNKTGHMFSIIATGPRFFFHETSYSTIGRNEILIEMMTDCVLIHANNHTSVCRHFMGYFDRSDTAVGGGFQTPPSGKWGHGRQNNNFGNAWSQRNYGPSTTNYE